MFPFRSEQYFGSPGDMASSAVHIRDKMKLVEDRKLTLHEEDEEDVEQLQYDQIHDQDKELQDDQELQEVDKELLDGEELELDTQKS